MMHQVENIQLIRRCQEGDSVAIEAMVRTYKSLTVEVGVYEFELPTTPTAIAIAGDYAYLAAGDGGLRVIDISRPTSPIEIVALSFGIWDVAVAANRVYLAEGQCTNLDGCAFGGLQAIDISDPARPHQIRQYDMGYSQSLFVADDAIYVAHGSGLNLFKQSDVLKMAGYLPSVDSSITDIAVKDEYVYLATGSKELEILNVAEIMASTKVSGSPPPPQNPHWQTYTPTDGLLGFNVTDILIDEAGRKWLSMDQGLNIFDGQIWQTYTPENGLADDDVTALAKDLAGQVWVSYRNGLSMFDGQSWHHYTVAMDLWGNHVNDLAVDSAGRIWFGATSGLGQFDGQKWTVYRAVPQEAESLIPIPTENLVNAPFIEPEVIENVPSELVDNAIIAVAIDPAEQVWVGAGAGLSRFDGQHWSRYTPPYHLETIMDMVIDQSTGQVWIATFLGGVSVFDGQSWTHYTTADGLASDAVYAIAIDPAGHKWFGTDAGVSVFDGETWTTYTTADGLADDFVQAIAIDPAGHVWFGTSTGAVSEFIP